MTRLATQDLIINVPGRSAGTALNLTISSKSTVISNAPKVAARVARRLGHQPPQQIHSKAAHSAALIC